MKISKRYSYAEQFPNRGVWDINHPSYLTIGGSGVVGTFGAESPMSEQTEPEGASMNSGSGAAAGAAPTYGGSGVA